MCTVSSPRRLNRGKRAFIEAYKNGHNHVGGEVIRRIIRDFSERFGAEVSERTVRQVLLNRPIANGDGHRPKTKTRQPALRS